MSRVTTDDVRDIFDTTLEDNNILAMIAVADSIVSNGPALSTNVSLTAIELKEIERWLAAHFCCIMDPIPLQAKIGDSMARNFPETVTTAWGPGLKQTVYGQQAIAIDRSGSLASMGKMKGSFRAVPREDSEKFTRGLDKAGL